MCVLFRIYIYIKLIPDAQIDTPIKKRLGVLTNAQEFVVHDQTIRAIRLDQIHAYTGPRFFIIDARAQVNIEQALDGYDAATHRVIRWVRVNEGVCPRRVLPTHPCHRHPHLCDFKPPPHNIPVKIFMLDLFGDDAYFTEQLKIYHSCLRPMNLPKSQRDCLDNMRTLMFAPDGTLASSSGWVLCVCVCDVCFCFCFHPDELTSLSWL